MSAMKAVTVPRWGMTMTEGTILEWLVGEGAVVAAGQELIEIETTKVTNIVESPGAGVLRRIVLTPGVTAPVGALAGVIADTTTLDTDIDDFVASYADRMGSEADSDPTAAVAPRRIEAGGRRINLLDSGGSGREAFVLLHGFGGDLSTWLFNQPVLSTHLRTIALDLPAHGASEAFVTEGMFDEIVAIVDDAITVLDLSAVHLVGHSFGGAVAAAVAARRASVMGSLCLIAPVGLSETADQAFLDEFVAADRRRPLQKVLEKLFADPSRISSDLVEGVLRFKRLEGVQDALKQVAATIAVDGRQRQSMAPLLEKLTCPIAVVWGEADAILPLPSGHFKAGITFTPISGVGHMPQMEAADMLNAIIIKNASL